MRDRDTLLTYRAHFYRVVEPESAELQGAEEVASKNVDGRRFRLLKCEEDLPTEQKVRTVALAIFLVVISLGLAYLSQHVQCWLHNRQLTLLAVGDVSNMPALIPKSSSVIGGTNGNRILSEKLASPQRNNVGADVSLFATVSGSGSPSSSTTLSSSNSSSSSASSSEKDGNSGSKSTSHSTSSGSGSSSGSGEDGGDQVDDLLKMLRGNGDEQVDAALYSNSTSYSTSSGSSSSYSTSSESDSDQVDEQITATQPIAIPKPFCKPTAETATVDLVGLFDKCWNGEDECFENLPYDPIALQKKIGEHNKLFARTYSPESEYGCIEKKDLPSDSQLFVRADLHGDLKSLLENLKTLHALNLLDEQFHCHPHVQLIFLGDYIDRGIHNMQVIELLISLRMENPANVTLLRGNHEDFYISKMYSANDPQLQNFYEDPTATKFLTDFFDTLTLSLYVSQESRDGFPRQYGHFTHGMLELYADPEPLLENENSTALSPISKEPMLSQRIKDLSRAVIVEGKMTPRQRKQIAAAKQIGKLVAKCHRGKGYTLYNWGDMSDSATTSRVDCDPTTSRQWKLASDDLQHYMRLSGGSNSRVKFLFRGHEHLFKHHKTSQGKLVATTLSVGMDAKGYRDSYDQPDVAYLLAIAPKVKDWQKQGFKRQSGTSEVDVTQWHSLRSGAV
jgi:hypothetical protein